MNNPRLVFFGNERIATGVGTSVPVLQALVEAGYQVVAVIVSQTDPAQSRKARTLEVQVVAEQLGIPVLAPAKLSDIKDQLRSLDAAAGVLVAYGKLVPAETISLFPRGIINIHPSLLPEHRGSTPIESVILNGTKETGVSLMQLSEEMDAGPIYAQEIVPLKGTESKQALADQLLNSGKDLLLKYLPGILEGSLQSNPQDPVEATYDKQIKKDTGELSTTKPATQLEREVRAYAGWPRSRLRLGTIEVIVTQAHVSDQNGTPGTLWLQGKELGVHCTEGTLIIDSLIPPGKKEMTASAFLAGYPLS
jgi:methionyl-tRNA formyltransferase